MTEAKWPPYWGHSLFCDEVRKEASGKDIYIGVYTSGMTVNAPYPYTHSQLSVVATYSEDIHIESKPLKIAVIPPGKDEPAATFDIGAEEIEQIKKQAREDQAPVDGDGERRLTFYLTMNIKPLRISANGRLKVRCYRDGEELKMGTLAITQNPEFESQNKVEDESHSNESSNA